MRLRARSRAKVLRLRSEQYIGEEWLKGRSGAPERQDNADGFEQDQEVQIDRLVFDVVEVILELGQGILH
jgi:hypothetical protein